MIAYCVYNHLKIIIKDINYTLFLFVCTIGFKSVRNIRNLSCSVRQTAAVKQDCNVSKQAKKCNFAPSTYVENY